ncbi:HEAT repeat domain-containing protein [bacterium]|nr:HEAT repeat domain-containing protein [bacterium]
MKNANAEVGLDNSVDCDAVLEINVQGKPLWGYYRGDLLLFTPFKKEEIPRVRVYFEEEESAVEIRANVEIKKMPTPWSPPEVFNPAVKPFEPINLLYAGAMLSGEISLKGKNGKIVKEKFQGYIAPPEYLSWWDLDKDPPYTPEKAPFLFAFLEKGSFPDNLAKFVGKFFGVEVLIPASGEMTWELDEVAKRAIGEFGKGALDCLIKALNNPNKLVRKNVVELLGWLNDKRAIPYLIKALADSGLKEYAARSLGRLKAKEAVDDLARIALNTEISDDIRKSAVIALGEIGGKKAVQTLWELTKDSPSKESLWDSLYLHALFGLANARESKAVKYLKEAWRDTHGDERVALALSKIGTPALETLIELLNDATVRADNRKYIAYALEELRGPRVVNALISSLRENAYSFSQYVGWALVKIVYNSITFGTPLVIKFAYIR